MFGQCSNSTRLSPQIIRMSLTSKRGKCDESREILYVLFHFLSFWSCLPENYSFQLGSWFSPTQCHHNLWARKRRTNDLSNLKTCKKMQRTNWATFYQTICRNWSKMNLFHLRTKRESKNSKLFWDKKKLCPRICFIIKTYSESMDNSTISRSKLLCRWPISWVSDQ